MTSLTPHRAMLIAVVAGFLIGVGIILTPAPAPVVYQFEPRDSATSTASIVVATSTPVATPPAPAATTTKPVAKASAPKPVPQPAPAPIVSTPITQAALEAAATRVRSALVNIICASNNPGVKSISGSGVIIDPKGVVLTNAHIAQYFLLATDPNQHISCVLRVGTPARDAYKAALVFISPAWLEANPKTITTLHPTGSGEHDYALLAILTSATSAPLPTTFAYTPHA